MNNGEFLKLNVDRTPKRHEVFDEKTFKIHKGRHFINVLHKQKIKKESLYVYFLFPTDNKTLHKITRQLNIFSLIVINYIIL